MSVSILHGDCRDVLKTLESGSVNCIVTSPPYYGLRDYGVAGQIGLEQTPDEYVAEMVAVFREARRVLRDDGVFWLNLGDSYVSSGTGNPTAGSTLQGGISNQIEAKKRPDKLGFGLSAKNLIGIPWRVAFALQTDGWILRQDVIWAKPNPMPESVQDRCTKAHEYVFMFSKSARYLYDAAAIAEDGVTGDMRRPYGSPGANALDPRGKQGEGKLRTGKHGRATGDVYTAKAYANPQSAPRGPRSNFGEPEGGKRNKRSVWTIATRPFAEAHFATMAPELARICIMAGCPLGGTVLDPFGGAGTTALVADQLQRNAVIIELNPEYVGIAERRINRDAGMFAEAASP